MLIIFRIFYFEHGCWKSDFVIEKKVWGREIKVCLRKAWGNEILFWDKQCYFFYFFFGVNVTLCVCLSTLPKSSGNFHECESFSRSSCDLLEYMWVSVSQFLFGCMLNSKVINLNNFIFLTMKWFVQHFVQVKFISFNTFWWNCDYQICFQLLAEVFLAELDFQWFQEGSLFFFRLWVNKLFNLVLTFLSLTGTEIFL
jgi:hypothetical protein